MGLITAPLTVSIDGKEYRDRVDISTQEFYRILPRCSELPHTSQVTAGTFEKIYREILARGDEVLSIHMSMKLSGTVQSARIAKGEIPEQEANISVIDSGTGSLGTQLLIREAVKMRDAGASLAAVTERLETVKNRVRVLIGVDNLKYFMMGGRISKSAAIVGALLGIKPIINVADGFLTIAQKVRGMPAVYDWLAKRLKADGFDPHFPPIFGYTGDHSRVEQLCRVMLSEAGIAEGDICEVGPVVGTHAGPGAVAVSYLLPEG